MAKGNEKKVSTKKMKATDLNALAKDLSDKYGIDVGSILELLLRWGPFLVDLVLKLLTKSKKKMGSVACSDDVKEHLDLILEKQAAALSETICAHCCLCCDDNESDEDE